MGITFSASLFGHWRERSFTTEALASFNPLDEMRIVMKSLPQLLGITRKLFPDFSIVRRERPFTIPFGIHWISETYR